MFIPPSELSGPPAGNSMVQSHAKTSFASGEWAPKLQSRVDIQKYHSGAALLRNFFVDYSGGGASTRQGTKFINQCKASGSRLVPFQPSTTVSYVLEFGQNYIRFYTNGAPVLEAATTISGATNANPGVITDLAHGYSNNDWVFISTVVGMVQLNGNYYIVQNVTTNTYTLTDLNGNAINTTGFGAYVSGGTAQRVYTLPTPYNASDLFPNPSTQNPGIKWVQNVTQLIICHPTYAPAILTINSAANWTYSIITFGATIASPAAPTVTSTSGSGGGWNYAYQVTTVDVNGQESAPSATGTISNLSNIATTAMTNNIAWTAVAGAVSYNVYKTLPSLTTAIPAGAQYGFIGNVTGTSMLDAEPGITPDFAQTPPIPENPFVGAGVQSYTVTANGTYTTVPTVTVAAPSSGAQATAIASLGVTVAAVNSAGSGYNVGDLLTFSHAAVLKVLTIGGGGSISTISIVATGSITSGSTPSNPRAAVSGGSGSGANFNLTWGVTQVLGVSPGDGYTSAPTVTFSAGAAAATAVLGPASAGNPGVPGFIQQRLSLSGQPQSLQSFNFSQPSSFFNFNISNPAQDDDAVSGSIIAEELNDIRWTIAVPTGMLAGTGRSAWLINGGGGISTQNPITPANITAQPQAFNGANDLRPLKINFDVLYATNKGNYVRDLSYNLYAQIFTGSDISVLANHLFFGFNLLDWTWAEEPFKTLWAIRSDGIMLSLGYVKEQELLGWAHHDTNGAWQSTCSVIETVNGNVVDAVYLKAQRLINGNLVEYVERMADRYFPYGYEDAWSVDCALQTTPQVSPTTTLTVTGNASVVGNSVTLSDAVGAPFTSTMATNNWIVRANGGIYQITAFTSSSQVTATVVQPPSVINLYTGVPFPAIGGYSIWQPVSTVSGLTQLIGQTVYGVADGAVVGPFIVSATGSVALGVTATKVTLGLMYLPQLKTLPLDLGEPTVQGKRKKITGVTLRVADTLGLQIGTTFANVVNMKDFIIGNIGTQSNQKVTGLVSGDGRTIIDQVWQEAGSYCIQQTLPYPATVLGAFPEITVGDK